MLPVSPQLRYQEGPGMRVISNDPALGARILKVVNSAFYGLPRQIGSINRAIVLLGLNAVKNIAIAASLTKLFRGGDLCPQFSARDLWIHSVACAAGSKLLCDELHLGLPDEAFLGGLIHDLGIMVEMQALRNELIQVFDGLQVDKDGVPGHDMREVEQKVLGADHCAFGAGLCEAWKFPKSFTYVTAFHHRPLELSEGSRRLACIVYVADRMSAKANYGFRCDLHDLAIDPGVLDELKITAEQVAKVEEALPQVYEEAEATLN
jgi:HD-like signal output (HDOD) protein